MEWVSIDNQPMPLEKDILVSHKYGIEAIHFFNGRWTYWYTQKLVDQKVLDTITHWMIPTPKK